LLQLLCQGCASSYLLYLWVMPCLSPCHDVLRTAADCLACYACVCCSSVGYRSSQYAAALLDKGHKAVNLQGGILAWVSKGAVFVTLCEHGYRRADLSLFALFLTQDICCPHGLLPDLVTTF
jgi:hypothetical protein